MSSLLCLKGTNKQNIKFLFPRTLLNRFAGFLLKFLGNNIEEGHFFLGDIDKSSNDSLYAKSRILSHSIATEISELMIEKSNINFIAEQFERNIVWLHLAKCYQIELLEFSKLVIYVQSIQNSKSKIFIQKPSIIPWDYVLRNKKFDGISFYPSIADNLISKFKSLLNYVRQWLRSSLLEIYGSFKKLDLLPYSLSDEIVFSINEESSENNSRFRQQHFWLGSKKKDISYFILETQKKLTLSNSQKCFDNVKTIPYESIGKALRSSNKDSGYLKKIKSLKIKLLKYDMFNLKPEITFTNACVYRLLNKAIEIGSLMQLLGVGKYVYKETHNIYSDAIELVSEELSLETFCIQYSNMPFTSTMMLSAADNFLIFSDIYRKIFSNENFGPKKFHVTGYPFREIKKSSNHHFVRSSDIFKDYDIDLIIGYFDESIEDHKFGLVSKKHHRLDIELLSQFVIDNKSIAVIIKTQFVRNTPSNLYKNNSYVKRAFSTGRLIELCNGDIRNDIYPTEVAEVADICIGHIFGATANLEVAINGCKSVLLNDYHIKPDWIDLINKNIIYPDLKSFLGELEGENESIYLKAEIGDWSECVSHFDPFKDCNSFKRIQNVILKKNKLSNAKNVNHESQ